MLTVVTASTDSQLTTTEAVKLELGITTTVDDDRINAMISRASRWAESYVGYPLTAVGYRETLAGQGRRRMMMSRIPVRAVSGLWDTTDTGQATTYLSSEFKVDRGAGMLARDHGFAWDAPGVGRTDAIPLSPSFFPGEEREPWLVDYVAGYTHAGMSTDSPLWSTAHGTTSTGRTLPEDIEEAVLRRTVASFEGELGVAEKRVGDLMIKYARVPDSLATVDVSEELLQPYRSVV